MTHFKLIFLVGWVTIFFASGLALAQGKGGQGAPRLGCQERFDALDTNKDGQVTQDEFLRLHITGVMPNKCSRQWMSTAWLRNKR